MPSSTMLQCRRNLLMLYLCRVSLDNAVMTCTSTLSALVLMSDVFLYRHDFDVQFDGDIPTSVFNMLQQACFQMAKTSYKIWQKEGSATKPSQHHQRFVYSRFMWGQCMCK